jgi:hypothetical protein
MAHSLYDLKKKENKLNYNFFIQKKKFWDKVGNKIRGKIIAIGNKFYIFNIFQR